MIRIAPLVALALAATPVAAAERSVGVGSFSRVRIDGAFDVRIATGASPRAVVTGSAAAIGRVDVHVDGATLVVRAAANAAGGHGDAPATIALATPSLSSLAVLGGAKVAAGPMKAPRVDVSLAGAGEVAIDGVVADDLIVTQIGTGTTTLGTGRVARVRLAANGAGTIDAAGIDAGDLTVRLEGTGRIASRARYTATVANAGLGQVTVAGPAKCTVRPATAAVACASSSDR